MMNAFAVYFDAPVRYAAATKLQERLVAARIAGAIPDVVLFLEHDPVITLGVRAREENVLLPPEELARCGMEITATSRGGDVTWHGPGQVIMYPIIKLGDKEADAHGYLHNLEEVAIRTVGDFGVQAFRRKGMTGAWTESGKIAAIGVRFKRWVAFHGLSFNVNPDLSGFTAIVPCGLAGERVTSMLEIMSDAAPAADAVRERLAFHFGAVCHRALQRFTLSGADCPALSEILRTSNPVCRFRRNG